MENVFEEIVISDDKSKIDAEAVIEMLSGSYWAAARPHERTRRAIENAYCVGAYIGGRQVAFARVVTDDATVYYLCDVIVSEAHRGMGIGKRLVEFIVNGERFQGMMGLLGTLDAHGLYEQYGFVKDPERFMKRPAIRT